MRPVLLALLATSTVAALDLSPYDRQLHLTASAAAAYVTSHVLDRTTDLPPWGRWLISSGTWTAASFLYEELNSNGYRDMEDARAGTLGALLGASGYEAALLITPTREGASLTFLCKIP